MSRFQGTDERLYSPNTDDERAAPLPPAVGADEHHHYGSTAAREDEDSDRTGPSASDLRGADEDDTDGVEDVDIDELAEIARRLDVPVSELLRQLRSGRGGDDDDDDGDTEAGTGADDSGVDADYGTAAPPAGVHMPTYADNVSHHSGASGQIQRPPSSGEATVGSQREVDADGTQQMIVAVTSPLYGPQGNRRASYASSNVTRQIRILGRAEDFPSHLDFPAQPQQQQRNRQGHRTLVGSQRSGGDEAPLLGDSAQPPRHSSTLTPGASPPMSPQYGGAQQEQLFPAIPAKLKEGRRSGSGLSSASRASSSQTQDRPPSGRGSTKGPVTDAGGKKKKKAVRFGEGLQQVHVFEVDNALFISIEYSRPMIGWVLLSVGLLLTCFVNCVDVFKIGRDPDAAIGFSTGHAIGEAVIALCIILPLWYTFMKPTRRESRFLRSRKGVLLVGITGLIASMMRLAKQSSSHINDQWRNDSTFALHPAIIVLYGKVFKNSVFIEECIGAAALLAGYALANMPTDIKVPKWVFAEVLTMGESIYVASFLFLCVKARGHQISVPVILASVAACALVLQLIVCAASGVPFDRATYHSAFEFAHSGVDVGLWCATSICRVVALTCFLLTLRFIPPLTVSTTLVLEPLVTSLVSFLLFFNAESAIWPLCPGTPGPVYSTAGGEHVENYGLSIYCSEHAFTYTFTFGALISALAAGYLVYVSSIKRSKVELILKKLKKRKVPKNPYKSRHSDESIAGRKYAASDADGSPPPLASPSAPSPPTKRGSGFGTANSTNASAIAAVLAGGGSRRVMEGAAVCIQPYADRRPSATSSSSSASSGNGNVNGGGSGGARREKSSQQQPHRVDSDRERLKEASIASESMNSL